MKILALETMGRLGSVATLDDLNVRAQQQLDPQQRSAQTITPAIGSLLKQSAWRPGDLELIAVVTGPGSFTGLRIGVTTAKVLAYAVGSEVIGVDALEVIATQTPTHWPCVHVVVGAERQQFFARAYQRNAEGLLAAAGPLRIIDIDTWLAERAAGDFVTGPGLAKIAERIPQGVTIAERDCWEAQAATVGAIGYRRYHQGQRGDAWTLLPEYGRRSAAEEKADVHDES